MAAIDAGKQKEETKEEQKQGEEVKEEQKQGEEGGKEQAVKAPTREGPKVRSPEGILMLAFAGLIAAVNGVLGLLDYGLPGFHALLSPIVNGVATIFIGGWIWIRGKKSPLNKAFKSITPFVLNTIPIPFIGSLIALIPYWLWAVWTNLEK